MRGLASPHPFWGAMVGMDKKDSTHRALVVDSGSVVLLGFPCAVFLYVVVRPQMLRIKAGMNLKDSDAGLFCWLCSPRCVSY